MSAGVIKMLSVLLLIQLSFYSCSCLKGMLYPRESETRNIQSLDGMWNFKIDQSSNRNASFEQKWYDAPLSKTGPVIPMAVPSSYNDITQEKAIRDFVGWAWYDRQFYVDSQWRNRRVVLRFESAHYYAVVWINSKLVMTHDGGHLPFEGVVNEFLDFTGVNRVTVAVNNTLTPHTLPPGTITYQSDRKKYPPGYFTQNLQMDFFNYAGLHRHVRLYTTPWIYIDDITVTTDIQGSKGIVHYVVIAQGNLTSPPAVKVEVTDKQGHTVGSSNQMTGTIEVNSAVFWYPYTMNITSSAYLYTLKVTMTSAEGQDVYRLPFGIRTIKVTSTELLINNQPFYCHGVAKHEDSDIRGKGLDYALIAKDFNMLKWLGANCFRTSHYPYAEEILDQADQQGIAIIDESPGVGIVKDDNFSPVSLAHHLEVMGELVRRDKNRPSVIMWSTANEPATSKKISEHYFRSVIEHTRKLDPTRPVTFVCNQEYNNDHAVQFVDIICLNRYYAWYRDVSHTELIQLQLGNDLDAWYQKFHKPIMLTEYGADTIPGLHRDPSFVFTEEFQVEFMREYHKVFDVKKRKYFVGEMVWNFADFMTAQGITRVVGNKKGILTRQRQPKHAAFLLQDRYHRMFNTSRPIQDTRLYFHSINEL